MFLFAVPKQKWVPLEIDITKNRGKRDWYHEKGEDGEYYENGDGSNWRSEGGDDKGRRDGHGAHRSARGAHARFGGRGGRGGSRGAARTGRGGALSGRPDFFPPVSRLIFVDDSLINSHCSDESPFEHHPCIVSHWFVVTGWQVQRSGRYAIWHALHGCLLLRWHILR